MSGEFGGGEDAPRLTPPVSERDHAEGSPDAPVTLVEYGDYECPHCGHAYPIVKSIQHRLGKKLRFVYRNFPLAESHPHARHAAEVAEAAAAQGKFWEMHDALFENQDRLEDEDLVEMARQLKLDAKAIARALEEGSYTARVREDFRNGVRSGVNGTPTFFINGERYDGSWADEDGFMRVLDRAAKATSAHR
ncbi:MAG: DsbA family protein [Gemmatimonadaceae bacterium]